MTAENQISIVKFILFEYEKDIDYHFLNSEDIQGNTALDDAERYLHKDLTNLLIKVGAKNASKIDIHN